jgi:deoxyribodipyrimidine photolyase-related protein
MRHFAAQLRDNGWSCDYYAQAENFSISLRGWVKENSISEVRVMEPNDGPFLDLIRSLELPCKLVITPSNHFLWSKEEFSEWASGKKRLMLEYFYRESRRRFNVLMKDGKPEGGQWNFDKENRRPPKRDLDIPTPLWFEPDETTRDVMEIVTQLSQPLFGEVEPFRWAVTQEQALAALEYFIKEKLPTFGPYEDAMLSGEIALWHSLLSPYVNIGLLRPTEMFLKAEEAFHERALDLPSVEGFIRQVIGWREFMFGVYSLQDKDYPKRNFFNHTGPLPSFFWTADTGMNCLREVISQVIETGYAHHIQRLMVLSNFALIAGVSPQETEDWFHAVFIDAYDWVMQTNVLGMGLFADGGVLATKPYAASANYINKMSDYCKKCEHNPKHRIEEDACPFNYLYWDFLARNEEKLRTKGRMNLILSHLRKMETKELDIIRRKAREWLKDYASEE